MGESLEKSLKIPKGITGEILGEFSVRILIDTSEEILRGIPRAIHRINPGYSLGILKENPREIPRGIPGYIILVPPWEIAESVRIFFQNSQVGWWKSPVKLLEKSLYEFLNESLEKILKDVFLDKSAE